nr:MAG TPA: hypothetical protein [Caudoviricetes sp.]
MGCWLSKWTVFRRLALTRESSAAAAGRRSACAHPWKGSGSLVGGRTGVGVCAGLGWALKGAQIGLGDFATFWRRGLAVGSLVQLCWSR